METVHTVYFGPSHKMNAIGDQSIDLVVTSPPYPMIAMWDEIMAHQNPEIGEALALGKGMTAFELMHKELDRTWDELSRVVKPGGIVCINIGDATRTINEEFRLFPNHARCLNYFLKIGFVNLTNLIWRKQTNAPNKFMGSGMLPAGAYVTLEHEYILIFRKGGKRHFRTEKAKQERRESAFFWEERNIWFSDVWWDLKGTTQRLNSKEMRQRSGAYPFDVPYRLINMFSLKGDTVLDPFLGTGTTSIAAITSARNSVGYEIDGSLWEAIRSYCSDGLGLAGELNKSIRERLTNHMDFIKKYGEQKGAEKAPKHRNKNYGFDVITSQEKDLILNYVRGIKVRDESKSIVARYFEEPLLECYLDNTLFSSPISNP